MMQAAWVDRASAVDSRPRVRPARVVVVIVVSLRAAIGALPVLIPTAVPERRTASGRQGDPQKTRAGRPWTLKARTAMSRPDRNQERERERAINGRRTRARLTRRGVAWPRGGRIERT